MYLHTLWNIKTYLLYFLLQYNYYLAQCGKICQSCLIPRHYNDLSHCVLPDFFSNRTFFLTNPNPSSPQSCIILKKVGIVLCKKNPQTTYYLHTILPINYIQNSIHDFCITYINGFVSKMCNQYLSCMCINTVFYIFISRK